MRLQDDETEDTVDKLVACVDSCYRAVCDIPQNYQDAIRSTKSQQWIHAMNGEIQSLEENNTFKITQLPPGKKAVGVDGCIPSRVILMGLTSIKPDLPDMTTVGVVLQKAVQEDLV